MIRGLHHWPQRFSLRTLLAAMLAFALVIMWCACPTRTATSFETRIDSGQFDAALNMLAGDSPWLRRVANNPEDYQAHATVADLFAFDLFRGSRFVEVHISHGGGISLLIFRARGGSIEQLPAEQGGESHVLSGYAE